MKRYKIVFKGRVQGVGFRFSSKMIADNHKLTGTVENLPNGDVLCQIQGEEENINKFLNDLENQRFIKIDSIDKVEIETIEDESSYRIIG